MWKALHIGSRGQPAVCNARWPVPTSTPGVINPSKSRIKVFNFEHEGRKVPYTCTQCDEACA